MSDENKDLETGVLESSIMAKKNVKESTQNDMALNIENGEADVIKNESAVTLLEKNNKTEQKKNTEQEEKTKQEKRTTQVEENKQYQFVKTNYRKKNHKSIILVVLLIVLLIVIALFSTIFALINSNNDKILSGIYIKDILLEGMTEEEAIDALNEKIESENKRDIILKIDGEDYSITPEQIKVQYNVEKAVQEAYNIGRDGNIFHNNFEIIKTILKESKVIIDFTYDEQMLNRILNELNAKIPNAMIDNTYYVEENNLVITKGTAGVVINIDSAKEAIINGIKSGNNEIQIETLYTECPEIDIEKIHEKVKTEPQNATYKKDPFEIIPHKNGLDFDVEEAKKILSEEKEEYVIALTVIEPEIHTNELGEEAFPDLLGAYTTKYDESNVSRSKNVKIAISKLNGVVVMPGEVFSYNKTLGKRTVEEGYEYASGFAGGKVVPMLGGGICQVSSTLYDAVLYANLEIVERYNHMFQVTYTGPGKDATVSYGTLDFKFKNTRNYPIMIKAKAGSGLAEIKIYGIKEPVEYDIEIVVNVLSYTPYNVIYENDSSLAAGREVVSQYGLQGCKSITYRIVKLNGQEVSREVLSEDSYDPLNKVVRRGVTYNQTPATNNNSTSQNQTNQQQQTPSTPQGNDTPATQPVTPQENPETTETPEEPEIPEETGT